MKFHKQGYPTLWLTLIIAIILIVGSYYSGNALLHWIAVGVSIFLLIVVIQFFRSPSRSIPEIDTNKIYTPADGKVVVIEKVFEPEHLKEQCWQISVFMSPLNVHINRNPVSGTVEYLKYHPGKYLAAWNPKASTENERFTTAYSFTHGSILIRQIAGALARRIVNNLKLNEEVNQGEEMGFIKFGSRVDVFVPLSAEIKVEMGQTLKSPLDVLAEFQNK